MKAEREKPLGLDMPFDEALQRFLGVDPDELPESIRLKKRGRSERPPPDVDIKAPKGDG